MTAPIDFHAQRRDAERALRARTDDPRELAAQLVGELARRGRSFQCTPGPDVVEIWTMRPLMSGIGLRLHRCVEISRVGAMRLFTWTVTEDDWQPYDHERALAHLRGEK